MSEPVITRAGTPISATGTSLAVHEWAHGPNAGPPLHVHHHDDEAWHVLEGTLRFRLDKRTIDVEAGSTVFIPAGVAHTFGNPGPSDARYLVITTPRVMQLISALHSPDADQQDPRDVYRSFDAELVE